MSQYPSLGLLVTIEHTGTMRTIQMLGIKPWPLELAHQPFAVGRVLFAHAYPQMEALILEAASRMPTLTTSRPMSEVRASWVRRGKDLADLDAQIAVHQKLLRLRPYIIEMGTPWQ
jgi:hypothetical protein